MATVTDEATYWEKAQQAGFDLSWLNQLKDNVIGDEVDEFSENNTGRVEGSMSRGNVPSSGHICSARKKTSGHITSPSYTRSLSPGSGVPLPISLGIQSSPCRTI